MKKIIFVYDHLRIGGIATYLINVLNVLDFKKLSVTLLVKSISDDVLSLIPEEVCIKYLQNPSKFKKMFYYAFHGGLYSIAKILFKKKNGITDGRAVQKLQIINAKITKSHSESYDIAIGTDIYWPAYYTAMRINAKKKYAWIHPQYNSLGNDASKDEKIFEGLDGIFAVSAHNSSILKSAFPKLKDRINYVENIVDNQKIRERGNEDLNIDIDANKLNLVTVCRIDNSSKRLDRVVEAAKLLREQNVDFVWRIIGDGPDEEYIRKMIEESGMSNFVLLVGAFLNPHPIVSKSDIFVLLSQYEGVPLAVTEAMILGIPVIVTKYESAVYQVPSDCGVILDNNDDMVAAQASEAILKICNSNFKPQYFKDNSESYKKLNEILGGEYICHI